MIAWNKFATSIKNERKERVMNYDDDDDDYDDDDDDDYYEDDDDDDDDDLHIFMKWAQI